MLQPSESEPTKKFLRCNFRGGWAGVVATQTLIIHPGQHAKDPRDSFLSIWILSF